MCSTYQNVHLIWTKLGTGRFSSRIFEWLWFSLFSWSLWISRQGKT